MLVAAAVTLAATGLAGCAHHDRADESAPTTTVPATFQAATTVPAPTTTVAPTATAPAPVVPDLGVPVLTYNGITGPDFAPTEFDEAGLATVDALVTDYVRRAVAIPLATGQAAPLDGLLTALAVPQLTPERRAVLTDEGMPRLVSLHADRFEVAVDGLAGPDGTIGIVSCHLDLVVSGTTADTGAPVSVARAGDLTFAWEPDNDEGGGAWRLDSFALDVERTVPG